MLRNLTIFYVEDFGIVVWAEDIGEVLAVGIGDENLSELRALDHFDDAFDSLGVEAVEDIV